MTAPMSMVVRAPHDGFGAYVDAKKGETSAPAVVVIQDIAQVLKP